MYFDLELEQKIDASRFLGNANFNNPTITTFDVDQSLTGDSIGWGFNVAMHIKATDWLSLGASYRSWVKQNVSNGNADFTKPAVALPATWFNDTDASGSIKLPDEVFLGVAIKPFDRLTWEVGGVWTRWSNFRDLTIDFENPIVAVPGRLSINRSVKQKKWNDVWRVQTGVEYKALDWLDARVGYVFDQEPIPDATVDYLVPGNDRHLFSGGLGFRWQRWTADLSYIYLLIEERDVEARQADGVLQGEFKDGHAHLFGVSLGYRF
jgi:long-chain fatty acid transport protein